jgi:uncharacterized protein YjbJ (UPF0337 family)
MSARASGDLDAIRRLLDGAVFRAALRVVLVAFFVPRFDDPFVVRVAFFAVLRTCLRVRLLVFRVLRGALFVVRLPAFRALRAAFFVVVVAFFAGMSCSSTLGFLRLDPGSRESTLARARPVLNHPIGCFVPRTRRARLATSLGGVARENNRLDAAPPASCPERYEEYRMPSENAGAGGVFDRLKGKAKQVAGSVLENEQLEREGELHEEKADAAQEAKRREAEASQEREEADLVARERDLKIEEQRIAADETAEAREDAVERERAEKQQRIEREHVERKADAARDERARQAQITADEQQAARERAQTRREASQAENEAEQARSTAETLDRAADKRGR